MMPDDELDVNEGLDEQESSESERKERDWGAEARSMGWNENYDGDDRIDAREYVLRKPIFDELRKLRKKARDLDTALMTQRQIQERLLEAEKREHEKQIRELKSQKMAAVQESDTQRVLDIDDEIRDLETKVQEPTRPATPDPVFTQWTNDNDWYGDDDEMTIYADAVAARLNSNNRNLMPTQILTEVSAAVAKAFPHKFRNPNAERTPEVGRGGPQRKSTTQEEASLSQEQVRVARTQWNAGAFGMPTTKGGDVSFKKAKEMYAAELRKAGMLDED